MDIKKPNPFEEPFRINEHVEYRPSFLTNLEAHFLNSYYYYNEKVKIGPRFSIQTRQKEHLTLATCFTDKFEFLNKHDLDENSRRVLLLLAVTDEGMIAGFRTMLVSYVGDSVGNVSLKAGGFVETTKRGAGIMVPLELAARDLLRRVATIENTHITQITHNMHLKELEDLSQFVNESRLQDQTARDNLAKKEEEQRRWKGAYTSLGFTPLNPYEMQFTITPSNDPHHIKPIETISTIELIRDNVNGLIDGKIVAQRIMPNTTYYPQIKEDFKRKVIEPIERIIPQDY